MRKIKELYNNKSRVCGSSPVTMPLFRFSLKYALLSMLMLFVLVVIAAYVRDSFVRPTLGDVLVVIWLYYFFASVINLPARILAIATVSVAFMVELGQYFKIVQWLGLEPSSPLHIALGATFDWRDLVAYSVGGVLCVIMDKKPLVR